MRRLSVAEVIDALLGEDFTAVRSAKVTFHILYKIMYIYSCSFKVYNFPLQTSLEISIFTLCIEKFNHSTINMLC